MKIQTERGLLPIETMYFGEQYCITDGYSYLFTSEEYGNIYSKQTENGILYAMVRSFYAINVHDYSIYDGQQMGESREMLLNRANKNHQSKLSYLSELCSKHPDCSNFSSRLAEERKSSYQILTWEEFQQGQRDYLLSDDMEEISREDYEDMLNILPPLKLCKIQGVEMFCMREMYACSYTQQYAKYQGKYYRKMVDCIDESTWIHHLLAA